MKMSDNKRRFGEVDDSDSDDQPQDTNSGQTGSDSSTNNQQDTESTTICTALFRVGTSNRANSGENSVASSPGSSPENSREVMDPRNTTNNDSSEAQITTASSTKRKRRRKGEPEPDHTATVIEKTQKMRRVPQACNRCHVSFCLIIPRRWFWQLTYW